MGADILSIEQIESISRLPARDVLHGQFVGVLASPLTTLVRGLAGMISGLASQLQQMADQGLVSGPEPEATAPAADEAAESADAEGQIAEPELPTGEPGEDATPTPQGDPVAEAAEETETTESDTPSEGETE
jgi:hypothetical protein